MKTKNGNIKKNTMKENYRQTQFQDLPSSGRKINRLNRSWTLSLYELKENHFIKIPSSSIPLFSCCLLSLTLSAWHLSLFSCLQNVYCHFKLVFCDYREILFLLLSLLIMRRNACGIRSTNTITAAIRSQVFPKVYFRLYFCFCNQTGSWNAWLACDYYHAVRKTMM